MTGSVQHLSLLQILIATGLVVFSAMVRDRKSVV